jgi:pimeloyl-ACP methyl ester carboxylesterase
LDEENTMSAAFEDIFHRSSDGLKLHARAYGEVSNKAPVVCIPGLTRNCRDFEDFAPWAAGLGRRVYAVDLRGRGQSDPNPEKQAYKLPAYVADMESLLLEVGAPRATFVGTSLGGLVTMALAARRPNAIAAAVLNDVGPSVARAGLKRIASYVGKSAPVTNWAEAAAFAKTINGAAFPNYDDARWMKVARRMFREAPDTTPVLDYDPRISVRASPLLIALTKPILWRAFKNLARRCPTLVLRGANSDILDSATLARMHRAAPALQSAEIPGVGHAPYLDEPESMRATGAFLSAQP